MSAASVVATAEITDEQVRGASEAILAEVAHTVRAIDSSHTAEAAQMFSQAERIFFTGAGRSGLVLRMAAMRFMHLGLTAYVVGESTTPAISEGDLLVVASGSGTTTGVVKNAEKAASLGAQILAVTTDDTSPLARLATSTVLVPAAQKTEHGSKLSGQYSGSLFEQSLFILTETIFQSLWKNSDSAAEELWSRHANLE
ncbi:6-phospho-3-hexuloisomerase [Glutamicibacter sp. JC586]|uniref:6-phospho-3-hexuloisomerase n=1 Tax=Glutamicibacter sp. JC586 TaxID=2590552 RepID=UPI001358C5CB|nr:6-phospho-3-hexuloisomerase [Glutamicibacter sp. JC586]